MKRWNWLLRVAMGLMLVTLTACSLPRIRAEDRLFLPIAVDFLDHYSLAQQPFDDTTLGGLSALAYDRQRDRFYALSDDRGQYGPSRFYQLAISWRLQQNGQPGFNTVTLESATVLRNQEGNPFSPGYLDPEGLALAPNNRLWISSEGDDRQNAPPLIGEFDRTTGQLQRTLSIPSHFLPGSAAAGQVGIRNNLGFEALTITADSGLAAAREPFRLFTLGESALTQDYDNDPSRPLYSRFLHYLVGPAQTTLIAEHAYPLDLEPSGAIVNGVTALLAIDPGGHFLALERAYGLRGFGVKLYQWATGGATDISNLPSLVAPGQDLRPIAKQLVVDFKDAPWPVDNLEGMALGPRLADGSQSLILISDNNFQPEVSSQLILLRLRL
ncbi:MAG: esterase-like activity of phytase family protein [Nodosilinea sp.]